MQLQHPEHDGRKIGLRRHLRVLLGALLIIIIPVAGYVASYATGYCDMAYANVFSACFFVLVAPIMAAFAVPVLVIRKSVALRLVTGVATLFAVLFLTVFVFPNTDVAFSHGFEAAVKTRADLDKLQGWAEEALEAYDRGELAMVNEASLSVWPGDAARVAESAIPGFLRQGVFRTWSGVPSVGISSEDRLGPAVVISWAFHGILVGRRDYELDVEGYHCPEYVRRIRPGVYLYHREW